jgi:hypothetical protein
MEVLSLVADGKAFAARLNVRRQATNLIGVRILGWLNAPVALSNTKVQYGLMEVIPPDPISVSQDSSLKFPLDERKSPFSRLRQVPCVPWSGHYFRRVGPGSYFIYVHRSRLQLGKRVPPTRRLQFAIA